MINGISSEDKWFLARWTKFTASENYKLLQGGNANAVFGAGAMTYIKTKALEMSTVMQERPELDEVKSLLWGKVHEYPAYEWYINTTKNYSMKYLGSNTPIFIEDEEHPNESGGSPDFLSHNDIKIDAGVEAKCSKNSIYHFERLIWKDQWDIKANYIECYTQIQNLLKITKADLWQFLSFDDRQRTYSKKGKIIDVYPDKKFQDNLDLRIHMAIKEKHKIFDRYMNN